MAQYQITVDSQLGLRGVDLIVSDDHGGLVRSIRQQLQGVTWQRCRLTLCVIFWMLLQRV